MSLLLLVIELRRRSIADFRTIAGDIANSFPMEVQS